MYCNSAPLQPTKLQSPVPVSYSPAVGASCATTWQHGKAEEGSKAESTKTDLINHVEL